MEQPNLSSDECTEVCSKSIASTGQVREDIAVLQTDVRHILKKLDDPHLCKWNGLIGQLIEFKTQSDPIRQSIFTRLDSHDTRINVLEDMMIEMKEGRKVMARIERQQKTNYDETKKNRRNTKWGIIFIILSLIIGFFLNIILEVVKGYI